MFDFSNLLTQSPLAFGLSPVQRMGESDAHRTTMMLEIAILQNSLLERLGITVSEGYRDALKSQLARSYVATHRASCEYDGRQFAQNIENYFSAAITANLLNIFGPRATQARMNSR